MDTWDEGQDRTGAGRSAGEPGGDPVAGRGFRRPGRGRSAGRRAVGVGLRCGLLVGVFALGRFVMGQLLGDPGPGPDPDIGGSLLVLAAVALTASLGGLVDAVRAGFRRAAVDWTTAIALLTALGAADVLRGWLDDRAALGGGLAVGATELVGPLVAIGIVAGAAATVAVVGAALGETVISRRGVGPAGPRPAA